MVCGGIRAQSVFTNGIQVCCVWLTGRVGQTEALPGLLATL